MLSYKLPKIIGGLVKSVMQNWNLTVNRKEIYENTKYKTTVQSGAKSEYVRDTHYGQIRHQNAPQH